MAFTTADLDAINTAIAQGASMVVFRDRTVQYRSVGDLLKARAAILADLAAENGAPRVTPAVGGKGL